MARRDDDDQAPEPKGGKAAERLRQFLEARGLAPGQADANAEGDLEDNAEGDEEGNGEGEGDDTGRARDDRDEDNGD